MATRSQIEARRRQAHALRGAGASVAEVARRLGVSASTVERDLAAPALPAEAGNTRAVTHGFYALAELDRSPRTEALAREVEAMVPVSGPADAAAVWLLAGCIERRIRGLAELEASTSPEATKVLRRDLSTVENTIARLLDQLGLTPTARARLGLDLTRAKDAALKAHLAERYGERS